MEGKEEVIMAIRMEVRGTVRKEVCSRQERSILEQP